MNKNVLSTQITMNVIDELRRERKILMVLNDIEVEKYINLDLSGIDLEDTDSHKKLDIDLKKAIFDKLNFREHLA